MATFAASSSRREDLETGLDDTAMSRKSIRIWGSGRHEYGPVVDQSYAFQSSSGMIDTTASVLAPDPFFFAELRLSPSASVVRGATTGEDAEFRPYDDEEALKWAAVERLPTFRRLRTSVLEKKLGSRVVRHQLDVTKIGVREQQEIVDQMLRVDAEEDNERFLHKLRNRIDRVGIRVPTIEIRYENVTVDAKCLVGNRALPTLANATINLLMGVLSQFGLSPTRKTELNILHNVSGILKPARMTLLLGPPASGKTTLLLALAAKLDPGLKMEGKVTYNGHDLDEFVPQRTSSYISQQDLHVPELTVHETLDFSARCQGVGSRYDMLVELAKREKEAGIFPDSDVDVYMKATAVEGMKSSISTKYIMKILGLDVCSNTIVGDSMRRGVSGGQKKRVTTGEIIVGPPKALMMDEISTGLDSSTTHRIVKCLSQFCHILEDTIMISLLQPDPETFALFDDVVLLSEGHVVYHGPREHVLEFFEACGFKCPERKGVADFLQEVTSRKDQGQYWSNKVRPYRYVSVQQFAERFSQFHVGTQLAAELAVPYDRKLSHNAALTFDRYGVSNLELFKANFARELLLMKRQSFVHVFKACQIAILALITMTTFFHTTMGHQTEADGLAYVGALFFGVVVIMFNGFSELSMTIFRLPVFFKQRDLLFFPAWTYALPSMVLSVPSAIMEAGVYSVITYYSMGFTPEPSRFFKSYLLLTSVHLMSSSMFRMIAGTCRTMVVANTGGSFVLMVVVLLAGFIIPKTKIQLWWLWGYWSSPLAYAVRAISVNELLAPRWEGQDARDRRHRGSLGRKVLDQLGIQHDAPWYWIGVAALVGFTVLFNFVYTLSLSYLNPLGKPQAVISETALAEKIETRTGEHEIVVSTRITKSRNSKSLRSKGQNPYENDGAFHEHVLQVSYNGNEPPNPSSMFSEATFAQEWPTTTTAATSGRVKKGMIMPFKSLSLSFNDINYFVPTPAEMKAQGLTEAKLQLLCGVTGAFRPGVLTALVGVSGAGKTTFMDVLAGRKTGGEVEGEIRVSGFVKVQETFARVAGYCEQNDIHSPQVTVRESLVFSAWLRLPSEMPRTRMQFVEEVMDLVELKPLEHALVGLAGVSGLSTEQRKRLTIAVELVANPSIIFMDEPTSGLDARAAAIVMRTVRNTVDTGRTVVCTIHQPSIDIFEAFDEMLLMKRGGRVIYMGPLGPNSELLIHYFECIPGVPRYTPGSNPAMWMLEATSVSVEAELDVDFADMYQNSALFRRNKEIVKHLSEPQRGAKDLVFPSQYSQSFWTQTRACLWKQHWTYWRSPDYNCVRFLFTFLTALLFGSMYWGVGENISDQTSLFSVLGAMYAAVLFLGVNNSANVQPVVAIERTIFYREQAAGMYSAIPYAIAQVLIEVPYCLVQTLLYAVITYSMMSLQWTGRKFFYYTFVLFFTNLYFTFYGMMAVAITPNYQVATILAAGFYSIFNLFSGFMIFKPQMPAWVSWYSWACPVAWTVYGLIITQFGDVTRLMDTSGGPAAEVMTVKDYVEQTFGMSPHMRGTALAMPAVFTILFAGVFVLGIKYLNFQQR